MPARQTLTHLDIGKSTFYKWLKRYEESDIDGLHDRKPSPRSVWNKFSKQECEAIIELALEQPELSPRELAVSSTDQGQFVSESSVYQLLKAQDLITSPAYILMQAPDKFQHPTKRVNEMWQTGFTYSKVLSRDWYCLSTALDNYSRFIVA